MVILETINKPLLKTNRVLEFATGFGRFTRHLVRVLPGRVTWTDVLPGSIEFLQEQFGLKTFASTHDPLSLNIPATCDLVFVLSMFTHLPPALMAAKVIHAINAHAAASFCASHKWFRRRDGTNMNPAICTAFTMPNTPASRRGSP